ncbi:MAG: hypothetical protein U0U25_05505 [Flavobacteriales bacterium]
MKVLDTVEIAEPLAPVTVEPVEPALREELLADVDERGQVTVCCRVPAGVTDMVRIWRSTYLICRATGHRSALVHAEGISYAPYWTRVPRSEELHFTLVFTPLPAECIVFDLIEQIPQPGGFVVHGIIRNERDLYHVEI